MTSKEVEEEEGATTSTGGPTTPTPTRSTSAPRQSRSSSSSWWLLSSLRRFLLKPSIWAAMVAVIAYWDETALHGDFVYDDSGSIKNNVVVTGRVPWTEVWRRDFWGTIMSDARSHKSFRPLTTLSFHLNYKLAQRNSKNNSIHDESSSSATTSTDTAATNNSSSAGGGVDTYSFHVVNVLLHGLVTAMATETATFVFPREEEGTAALPHLLTGFLFALHPLHAEAVSNMTSRGELLMSLFYLAAFLSYARALTKRKNRRDWQRFEGLYVVPCVCMVLSLFSKEQGATALISCVVYDFVHNYDSLRAFAKDCLRHKKNGTLFSSPQMAFMGRTVVLALQTILAATFRYWLNIRNIGTDGVDIAENTRGIGQESREPDFVVDQNPAAFAEDRWTRIFSMAWVHCLYIYDVVDPRRLSPDWSGKSIDLLDPVATIQRVLRGSAATTNENDEQHPLRDLGSMFCVFSLWFVVSLCLYLLIAGKENGVDRDVAEEQELSEEQKDVADEQDLSEEQKRATHLSSESRKVILLSVFAFVLAPFLLSSNLFVAIGLMKADRVMYLPLLGFCMLEAWVVYRSPTIAFVGLSNLRRMLHRKNKSRRRDFCHPNDEHATGMVSKLVSVLVLVQLYFWAGKVHERNVAWSDSLRLWTGAFVVNPRSHHTRYNCGYELSLRKRYKEAEVVLRPLADPHVDGPTNTFVYAMVLFNLDECRRARPLIDRALAVVSEKRASSNSVRDNEQSLSRVESNLLVAQAFCTEDMAKRGQTLYRSVETDPTNEYAIQQATIMAKQIEQWKEMGLTI